MIHWFTRNTQYESRDTIALLDSILDGIVDSSNTSLRDFCGECVQEFLIWSIKQTSKKVKENCPLCISFCRQLQYFFCMFMGLTKDICRLCLDYNLHRSSNRELCAVEIQVLCVYVFSTAATGEEPYQHKVTAEEAIQFGLSPQFL